MHIANMEKELVSSHFWFLRNFPRFVANLEAYLVLNANKYSKASSGGTDSPELGCLSKDSGNIEKISMNMSVTSDGGPCFADFCNSWTPKRVWWHLAEGIGGGYVSIANFTSLYWAMLL